MASGLLLRSSSIHRLSSGIHRFTGGVYGFASGISSGVYGRRNFHRRSSFHDRSSFFLLGACAQYQCHCNSGPNLCVHLSLPQVQTSEKGKVNMRVQNIVFLARHPSAPANHSVFVAVRKGGFCRRSLQRWSAAAPAATFGLTLPGDS